MAEEESSYHFNIQNSLSSQLRAKTFNQTKIILNEATGHCLAFKNQNPQDLSLISTPGLTAINIQPACYTAHNPLQMDS